MLCLLVAVVGSPLLLMGSKAHVSFDSPPFKVSGKVTDEDGEALVGVSILVKGTTQGTVTELDGGFTIEVAENSTLVFSYTGYLTQEIEVGNRTAINITMAANSPREMFPDCAK